MKESLPQHRKAAVRWLLAGVIPLLGISLGVVTGSPPAGASEAISGTVLCPVGPVAGTWIQAAKGGSGFARFSPAGQGDVSYQYSLANGGAWTVHVGCGIGRKGAWQYTPDGNVSTSKSDVDWICFTPGDGSGRYGCFITS